MEATTRLWVSVSPAVRTKMRNRAGLRFEHEPRTVDVVDATDDELAERQKRGESIVSASGAAAILEDAALEVRDTPPPPAIPRPARPVHLAVVAISALWVAIAKLLGVKLPVQHEGARLALLSAIGGRARDAADPAVKLWRRIAELVETNANTAELCELLFGVGAFGDTAPAELPLVGVQRWAMNEALPAWMTTIARGIGIEDPAPQVALPRYDAKLQEALDRAASHDGDKAAVPQLTEDLAASRDLYVAAIANRNETLDTVRRRVLASIDDARSSTRAPFARYALDVLARSGRGLPTGLAFGVDDALGVVLGSVTLRPVELVDLEAATVRVAVSTRYGIELRRRAGFEFSPRQRIITCTEDQARLIDLDDGLWSDRLSGDSATVSIAEERRRTAEAEERNRVALAEIAQLKKEAADREAAHARRGAVDPHDGRPSRLRAAAIAAAKRESTEPTDKPTADKATNEGGAA